MPWFIHRDSRGSRRGLNELARDIQRHTEQIKRDKLYLASVLALQLAQMMAPFLSSARQKSFYSKDYPLCGGITNIRLNQIWPQAPDYFRVVCTGPVVPLVLAVTTAGERANIGLTYCKTAFSAPDIAGLKEYFESAVRNLEGKA